jgi:hypothetical protein
MPDVVIADAPQARLLLQQRFPLWKGKINDLPNGFDP